MVVYESGHVAGWPEQQLPLVHVGLLFWFFVWLGDVRRSPCVACLWLVFRLGLSPKYDAHLGVLFFVSFVAFAHLVQANYE